ncbi:MAG: DUF2071 domain-containing protein [Gemmatales bacterium]|nr:DUF2071 domain-containing protein [Gemmatales bacterium]MDW8222836.1 DUF2071 domain-containing protein [Gemmatales bacterium]
MWQQHLRGVLFLHWPVSSDIIRPHLPACLEVDEYDKQAWISLVLLQMQAGATFSPWPRLRFAQVNLRTYVRCGALRGIWFFSVHAHHHWAAQVARWFTPIPYASATVHYQLRGSAGLAYARCRKACFLEFHIRFSWSEQPMHQGSLGSWLLERYHLLARDRQGTLLAGNFEHAPWTTFPVWVESYQLRAAPFADTVFASAPLAHFSPGLAGRFGAFVSMGTTTRC